MTEADYQKLYNDNEDFHNYVIRYCRNEGCSTEQALRKKIIRQVGESYLPGGCNYNSLTK